MRNKKIWCVAHPLDQYKEDVMELAAMNRLKVIDPVMRANLGYKPVPDSMQTTNPPALTLKTAKKKATKKAPVSYPTAK